MFPKGSGIFPKVSGIFPKGSGIFPKGSGIFPKGSGIFPKGSGEKKYFWSKEMDEKKYVLTEELASEEFEKWASSMDIDLDESVGDDKDLDVLVRDGKKVVVKALMRGSMVLNDEGNLEYTLSCHSKAPLCGEKLVLGMPPASVYAFQKGNTGDMIFGFVSGMTGKDKGYLAKISYADFKVLQGVAGLFLRG